MELPETDEAAKGKFKKPILIGKIGRLPRKVSQFKAPEPKEPPEEIAQPPEPEELPEQTPAQVTTEKSLVLPYKEPPWSGLPQTPSRTYSFEVLKSGSIIGNVDLMGQPFWVFGRLGTCDVCMAHPTVSRYHAILQYRKEADKDNPKGFYLYDLSSTHGTFLNKSRLKQRVYARVQVGHMIKIGCSSRTFILVGPEEDSEEVSEFSVSELKQKRAEELQRREQAEIDMKLKLEQEAEKKKKLEDERGVDWGMGEDADEESDLAENPFAQTNNEELYLDDPKKALRGFMEREGCEYEYDCSEQGMGQFLCKVVLPLDDDKGRPIVAEVLHKGKKKEAVVQCALEACRILDRHGILRQAVHESRKRKAKNWEENDFYDSDDDTYLDRTGSIEKKRENRMKLKLPQQPETYQSLLEKEQTISKEIRDIETQLEKSRAAGKTAPGDDLDSLDMYMKELKQPKLDKQKITKLKSELSKLKQNHAAVIKLVNIARPADLPPLVAEYSTQSGSNNAPAKPKLPMFGKRIKVKVQKPDRSEICSTAEVMDDDEEEEDNQESTKADARLHETSSTAEIALLEESPKEIVPLEEPPKKLEVLPSEPTPEELEKKRKKNLKRIQQRQEKTEAERLRGYEEDAKKEDYNMWVPPQGQSGDGKTSLNDKFGY